MDKKTKIGIGILAGLFIIATSVYVILVLTDNTKTSNTEDDRTTTGMIEDTTTTIVANPNKEGTTTTKQNSNVPNTKENTTTTTKSTTTTTTTTKSTTTKPIDNPKYSEAKTLANSNKSDYNTILNLTNQLRQSQGVATVTLDNDLCVAATYRAIELTQKLDHIRPDGSNPNTILKELKISYRAFGENITYSTNLTDANWAYTQWYESTLHKNNMLDTRFHKMGIGKYVKDGKTYWVQLFTN